MSTSSRKICMLIGDPVTQSLSPAMHNAAYQAVGLDEEFVYIAACVKATDLPTALSGVRALGIKGVSCTIPHKQAVIDLVDEVDSLAASIGAVNTVVNDNGFLKGYNTDCAGVVAPLQRRLDLKGKSITVLGAGGAARAAVFGLIKEEADVLIANRTAAKGEKLAEEAGCRSAALTAELNLADFEVIVNATSVGMFPKIEESPLQIETLRPGQIVFDLVYNPYETKLIRDSKMKGCAVIHGLEMFIAQGAEQFRLFTGESAPLDVMQEVVQSILVKTL